MVWAIETLRVGGKSAPWPRTLDRDKGRSHSPFRVMKSTSASPSSPFSHHHCNTSDRAQLSKQGSSGQVGDSRDREGISQSVNQSISQSVNQSISQSVNQSISQSVNQSISQSVNQPVNQSISQSVNQSISQSVNQSVNQSISQSVSQSLNQSISQSVNQSINQSVNQSISQHRWNLRAEYFFPHLLYVANLSQL